MSKRSIYTVLIVVAVLVLAALIYVLVFGMPGSSQARQLDASLQKWQAQNVSHYRMNVNIGCFCPFFDRMPVTVEVRDGQVLSVTDSQGQVVAADDPIRSFGNEQLMTVEGVFAYARDAFQTADKTEVTYDPTLGYPVSLNIDRIEQAIDDEMSVLISEFEVLP
jgi:FlaG/FlaF family flagellin (archaellin)